MKHGSSERITASSIILLASVIFTLTTYFIFTTYWGVEIPVWQLLGILGLQLASILLGSTRFLTYLGAASLSALIGVFATTGAVVLTLSPGLELKIAGGFSAAAALLFILASVLMASRYDPAPDPDPDILDLDSVEDNVTAELIKYGEIKGGDEEVEIDLSPFEFSKDIPHLENTPTAGKGSGIIHDKFYEFNGLSDSDLGFASDKDDKENKHDPLDLDLDGILLTPTPEYASASETVDESTPGPGGEHDKETATPDDWLEETTRSMGYEQLKEKAGGLEVLEGTDERSPDSGLPGPERLQVAEIRTRYKILDALSGDHYGTYYCDEGHSIMDPSSLAQLPGSRLPSGEVRIARLDWTSLDEVEVHIAVEGPLEEEQVGEVWDTADEIEVQPIETGGPASEVETDFLNGTSETKGPLRSETDQAQTITGTHAPRYFLYDRRTIQPLGEYVPSGDRPRIDRLTLYRMFPQFNYRSFEIDSIRWEDDEVRIFIRGERKTDPGSAPRVRPDRVRGGGREKPKK